MISIISFFFLTKKKNALKITTKMTKLRFVINICDLKSLKKGTVTYLNYVHYNKVNDVLLKMKSIIEIFTNLKCIL